MRLAFPNLKHLSLIGNPACYNKLSGQKKNDFDFQKYRLVNWIRINNNFNLVFDYRDVVRSMLPKLLTLDSTDLTIDKEKQLVFAKRFWFNERSNKSHNYYRKKEVKI